MNDDQDEHKYCHAHQMGSSSKGVRNWLMQWQHASSKEFDAGTPIHAPLEGLQPVDQHWQLRSDKLNMADFLSMFRAVLSFGRTSPAANSGMHSRTLLGISWQS